MSEKEITEQSGILKHPDQHFYNPSTYMYICDWAWTKWAQTTHHKNLNILGSVQNSYAV